MNRTPTTPPKDTARARAWRIVVGYWIFATLWIILSDRALEPLLPHSEMILRWSLVKGLLFVMLTSVLLWYLVRRTCEEIEASYQSLATSESEQRELANQLAEERSRLVEAQRVAEMGWWESDLVTGVIAWSEEMHRIFETDPATFVPTFEIILKQTPEEERARVEEGYKNSVEGTGPDSLVHRARLRDGRVKHLELHWKVFRDGAGKPVRLLGTCRDVTAGREAEQALRDSETRFREMAENIGEVFYSYDIVQDRLLYMSPAYETVWGRPLGDIYADTRAYMQDILPEDRPMMEEVARKRFAGESAQADFRIRRPDGEIRWLRVQFAPIPDASGKVGRVVGTMRDITASKIAETQLVEQAALIEKARDAIIVLGLDHQVIYWNHGASLLYGWTAEEAMGRSVRELLYQNEQAFLASTRAVLEQGEWSGEIAQFTRAGQAVTVDGRWTLLRDPEGKPRSILSINTDITGRKQLEQQFLRAQRMESIGTLAGGIAHDLNNVLAPVIMSVDLLKHRLDDAADREILEIVGASARRGADMVQQILSFARGMEGRRVEVDVGRVLQEVVRIIGDTFPKSIRVELEAPAGLLRVHADPTQLHQVLLNLCVNARDAMPDGGLLRLRAVNVNNDEPRVRVDVEDTGSGIPAGLLGRIFDPFFTSKEPGKGTGLGLSTALAIVRGHGGTLEVASEPGEGTTFTVSLPALGQVGSRPSITVSPSLPRGRGETVLVVDDEASIRHITRQTLEAYGYEILDAADGAEAITLFVSRRFEIDVVITDMAMPRVDGPALIRELRRIDPTVPVIGVSGVTSMASFDEGGEPVKFLPKPYTTAALLTALRDVLEMQVR
ncbi:PAS domain S-box protein [Luteolibacter flavescens]|uniref:histidine kinase n=1 Tax=Luteolibacter flavescens TaxID=1859460 RepID=A0ABT3FQC4_9BACT|nr:PAS domain S-box protein [Luteolibacter flavescens]MCW1885652.1 PAS domain S-box protein [Luteolibacter flavescens]